MSNNVRICGILKSFEFSHTVLNERFYMATVSSKRLSGTVDYIPILVSEKLHVFTNDETGCCVNVTGEYRSHNLQNKLILYVFADNIEFTSYEQNTNEIYILGFICKEPTYRITPSGRHISDLLIASNRKYNKSDYIPCIAWGRNAKYISNVHTGDNVEIIGRLQSREYIKDDEVHIAYEVSVFRIDLIAEE